MATTSVSTDKTTVRHYRTFRARGYTATVSLDMARGLRAMWDNDWDVTWEPEVDVDLSWCDCAGDDRCSGEHEVFCAFLRDSDGKILECLGNITDPSREYMEDIEAELAIEAMHRNN